MSEFILEIVEQYDRGFQPDEIASHLRVSVQMVYDVLENHSDAFKLYVAWLDEQDTRTV